MSILSAVKKNYYNYGNDNTNKVGKIKKYISKTKLIWMSYSLCKRKKKIDCYICRTITSTLEILVQRKFKKGNTVTCKIEKYSLLLL